MFKENFIKLCNKRGVSPSFACREVGITPATFSGWSESTIPREATLFRIADYFNVTVDYLLTGEETQVAVDFALSTHEKQVVTAYRDQPQMQPAVDKLLGIDGAE